MAQKLGGKGASPKKARKAKAEKQAKPAAPEGSEALKVGRQNSVSAETKARHWNAIRMAKARAETANDEYKSKNGEFRAAVKKAKDAGCDTDAMLQVLKLSKMEPELIAELFGGINEFMVIAKIPVPKPVQLGLFSDGSGIGERVDNEAIANGKKTWTAAELDAAEAAGEKVGLKGRPITDNPHEDGSPIGLRWVGGWRKGQNTLAAGLGRGGAPVPQAATAH